LILNQSGKVVAVGVMAAAGTTVAVGMKAATVGAREVDGVRGTAVLHAGRINKTIRRSKTTDMRG
jgi:hypothetical protein